MRQYVETVRKLGQGQRVRLTFADASPIEVQVNQTSYDPDDSIRLELTTDYSGDSGRYLAGAQVEDGEWTDLRVQRYDRGDDAWTTLEGITGVVPIEMYRTMKSDDMEAQEETGTEEIT